MSDIIALKGRGNSGKTQTIKAVFKNLKIKYPSAKITILEPNTTEIKIIIDINGIKVGLESQGDPNSRLKQSLSDFSNAKCDIIICATRTSGMTVQWVNSYSSQYNITFLQQSYVLKNSQSATNIKTANHIISVAGL
ncbi:MAG TPA: hypothetical protein EYH06_07515 [Chromatiales bacterium]|nr:hypothetical protein [Thiotrichales bacterium]HIP68424.1 hypothetical protein [Chromatiales bacterium]